MDFRRTPVSIFLFTLPGLAAGWILSGGVLRLDGGIELAAAIFAAFALAGALFGRWAVRSRAVLGAGLLFLLVLPEFPRLLLPLTAFGFGVFAVRPIKSDDRTYFQCGVLAAVVAGFLLGGEYLLDPRLLRYATVLCLPAAAMLAAADRRHLRILLILGLFIGAARVVLPVRLPAGHRFTARNGVTAEYRETLQPDRTRTAYVHMGENEYQLPRDFTRRQPDLLPAALQPGAPTLRVLTVSEIPSAAAETLERMHWVALADRLRLSPLPYAPDVRLRGKFYDHTGPLDRALRRYPERRYDLIFILDMPSAPRAAQRQFLHHAAAQWLAPGGVLVAPEAFSDPMAGFHTALLPGSMGRLRLWAADGTALADTFPTLEQRLKERSAGHTDLLPGGMLETLYGLRAAEPDVRRNAPNTQPGGRLRALLKAGADRPLSGVFAALTAGGLVLAGFWLGRYPRYGDHFAIFARGAACMLFFLPVLQEADKFRLLADMPVPALFGLLALALPHRTAHTGSSALAAMVLAAVSACTVRFDPQQWRFTGEVLPQFLPAAALMALLLAAPVFRIGTGHQGSESARYLHFLGLLTGLALAVAMPYWYALPVALLLFWL